MTERAIVPTHSAFLELKEERSGMREGYRFLDEKRLILAAEILAELGRYEREMAAFGNDYREATEALQGAVARHGLEGLAVYPPTPPLETDWQLNPRRVLGVTLLDLVETEPRAPSPAVALGVATSPEAEACRKAFEALIPRAARLAAMVANLQRLRADYARTARRARALEDVLLPEIDDTLRAVESALEELEREEVVRARPQVGRHR
ncbi:V-type ATP synthase, subunit D [Thiocapsa sp. KS1]|jgi:V/A-type H+-transporting ATPase subunit D|nr:V-type ATP synthase subunit D [Thiocapsa sp. KS1]CRI66603.1 V-type ATP synthase, subunit D [Thiocapsa sp. KS1]